MNTRTQIGILKSRGMLIKNKKAAKQMILSTNYYNLINGYKELFIDESSKYEKYIKGTKIEEIYALYDFDKKLRTITLKHILEFEKRVKSVVSYCFSREFGHCDYLNVKNFDICGGNKYNKICDLLSVLYRKIKLNIDNDPSVAHYALGKNYIPLWVLVNAISMGDISKFYSNMMQQQRQEVSKRIKWGLKEDQLSSCLLFLSSIRNRCAHDELLYSYLSYSYLCNNNFFKYFKIHNKTNNYFAVMVALKLVISDDQFKRYSNEIDSLFCELSRKVNTISMGKVKRKMGIPNNWIKLISLN